MTVSGAIVTRTVTSTPSLAPTSDSGDRAPLQRKALSGGAIAGIVIGTLLGVAALILGACLLWRRKKPQTDAEGTPRGGDANKPKRTASVLSHTGLLMRGRAPSVGEKDPDDSPYYANNSVRHSMLFGGGGAAGGAGAGEAVSPVSPLGSSYDRDDGYPRRYSRPLVYDQRLNPSALFANAEGNASRVSIQDQQDYSRPLGIANPDFARPSFESRA